MDPLPKKVYELIRRERLFEPHSRVVVGVSGGADSVALLFILRELAPVLKLRLTVAHFNHRWRGAESDADEKFVAGLTRRLKLPLRAGRASKKPGQNREACSREDRYQFLAAAETRAVAVAVAHHADDQAETFLINLLRGAGPDGLAGMAPVASVPGCPDLRLVRPLLGVTRAALRAYLGRIGQDWREDSSNLDPDFLRNRVRAELLPLLVSFNPAIAETLGRTADVMREQSEAARLVAVSWLGQNAAVVGNKIGLPLEKLRPWPAGLRLAILREALRRLVPGLEGISRRHLTDLDRVSCSPFHGVIDLPGLTAEKIYDLLELSPVKKTRRKKASTTVMEVLLPAPGRVKWAGPRDQVVTISARQGPVPEAKDFFTAAALDPRKISGRLRVRGRKRGDRYQPTGCAGRRSLKDVFNQLRVPPPDRDRWPLVVDDEEIIWVPGIRPAEKVAWFSGPALVVAIAPGLRSGGIRK